MKKAKGLTGRQAKGIIALVECGFIESASRDSGIGRTTFYEWMKDRTFTAELERARRMAFTDGLAVMKGATERAAGILLALLESRNETTRRLTAGMILEFSMKANEAQDIEARIKKLEDALILPGRLHGAA